MMPGRVLTVSVKTGDSVSRGQALMVIESMKMENTVASPRDGTVRAVHVSEGATVQHGQSLVEFE
jgi:pyruvate carboxylase